MTIREDLRKELDHLLSMMPVWQRWEKLKHIQLQQTKAMNPVALADYFEAHWRTHFMMEKIEYITKVLANNNE